MFPVLPLVDVFCFQAALDVSYVWLRLPPDGFGFVRCAQARVGEEPEWLEEYRELGWGPVADLGHTPLWSWALENGLCPGQPFCVRLLRPVWERDYWGEGDCTYPEAEIVARMPRTTAQTIQAWCRVLPVPAVLE